jgi:hypothetical protein
MNQNSDLALAKQAFDELLSLCAPEHVAAWQPTDDQRAIYVQLAERAREGVQRLKTYERWRLLNEGSSVSVLPEALLVFVRDQIRPRDAAIRAAIDHLDPEGKPLRESWAELDEPWSSNSRTLLSTFQVGLDQIYRIQEDNPGNPDLQSYAPDTAYDLLNSPLIRFEPDAWFAQVQEILPIRTHNKNFQLPSQIRWRFEELYRAYIFGLWLSVFALARAILEYSILDNASKFKIEVRWPDMKEKRLSHLIDELAEHLPTCRDSLQLVRTHGNDYVHPKKTQASKAMLLQRQRAAQAVMSELVALVEAIYLARRPS